MTRRKGQVRMRGWSNRHMRGWSNHHMRGWSNHHMSAEVVGFEAEKAARVCEKYGGGFMADGKMRKKTKDAFACIPPFQDRGR